MKKCVFSLLRGDKTKRRAVLNKTTMCVVHPCTTHNLKNICQSSLSLPSLFGLELSARALLMLFILKVLDNHNGLLVLPIVSLAVVTSLLVGLGSFELFISKLGLLAHSFLPF